MGITKWNKQKENMTTKSKKHINTNGFTQLPQLSTVVEASDNEIAVESLPQTMEASKYNVIEPMTDMNESIFTATYTTDDNVLHIGNITSGKINVGDEVEGPGIPSGTTIDEYEQDGEKCVISAIPTENGTDVELKTRKPSANGTQLANDEFYKKLKDANLGKDVEILLGLHGFGKEYKDAWSRLPESAKKNSEHCDDGDDVDFNSMDENKKNLKYTRVYVGNVLKVLLAVPKLFLLGFDAVNWAIKRLVVEFCEILNENNENKITEDDFNIIFAEVDKFLYLSLVFYVSLNWFIVLFFYTKDGDYVSSSNFITDVIKDMMRNRDAKGQGFFDNVLSSSLYPIAAMTYIFTEHSTETMFTIPNLLQMIVSLQVIPRFFGALLPLDIFDSLPVKYLLTVGLTYIGLAPMAKALQYLVGIHRNTISKTDYVSIGLTGLVSLFSLLGFAAWQEFPFGADKLYWVLKEVMNPNLFESAPEDNADEASVDPKDKAFIAMMDKMNDKLSQGFTAWLGSALWRMFLLFIRIGSIMTLMPLMNTIIFIVLVSLSFFSFYRFNVKRADVFASFMDITGVCYSLKDNIAKGISNINPYLIIILLCLLAYSSFNQYNSLSEDIATTVGGSLKAFVIIVPIIAAILPAIFKLFSSKKTSDVQTSNNDVTLL